MNRIFIGNALFIYLLSFPVLGDEVIRYGQKGSLHPNGGGFVAHTAEVDPTVYVGKNAAVLDLASVLENVRITGFSQARGTSRLSGDVELSGFSRVGEYAQLSDNVKVSDFARIGGQAYLSGNVEASGFSKISGYITAVSNVRFFGWSRVSGNAVFYDMVWVSGAAFIAPIERTKFSGREWITGVSAVERFEALKRKIKCYF